MDGNQPIVRNRTMRRRAKNIRLTELREDLDKVEIRLSMANTKNQVIAYTRLHDIIYGAYLRVCDSEV